MRGQELLQVLTNADVKLVNEAANPQRVRRTATRWIAAAACLAVVAGAVLWQVTRTQPPQADLPMLTIVEKDRTLGDGGGEYGVVYTSTLDDIPLERLAPATDGTLPVYTHEALSSDPQVTLRRIQKAGELLGMGEDAVLTGTTFDKAEIEAKFAYYFYLVDGNLKLEAGRDSTGVQITFREPIPLPGDGTYEHPLSEKAMEELRLFFEQLCREKLNMSAPTITVAYEDPNASGNRVLNITGKQGDSFQVSFSDVGADNRLSGCRFALQPQCIGNYPIISEAEAWERLENGHYLGLSGYGQSGRQPEKRVDLLYYADAYQTVNMPYYRFFVYSHQFGKDDGGGVTTVYEVYHVPAVESAYITALPEDGRAVGLPDLPEDLDALILAAEALWEDVDVPAESLLNYQPYTGE